jgi:hypothetical protein
MHAALRERHGLLQEDTNSRSAQGSRPCMLNEGVGMQEQAMHAKKTPRWACKVQQKKGQGTRGAAGCPGAGGRRMRQAPSTAPRTASTSARRPRAAASASRKLLCSAQRCLAMSLVSAAMPMRVARSSLLPRPARV